jgi:hypothetical protein
MAAPCRSDHHKAPIFQREFDQAFSIIPKASLSERRRLPAE